MPRAFEHTPRPQPSADFQKANDQALFQWFEENWIVPCWAKTPKPLHGLCVYAPAFLAIFVILGGVALLAWMEQRDQKRAKARGPKSD